ncbi:MAG: hypothetical protein ACJAT1_001983 [Marivirga sp.]|jgi:hypothetical protein
MRKLSFIFALALFSYAGTANSNNEASVAVNNNTILVESTTDQFKTCTTTIKGTIGGQEVDLEITFEADNCAIGTAKLLKELATQ